MTSMDTFLERQALEFALTANDRYPIHPRKTEIRAAKRRDLKKRAIRALFWGIVLLITSFGFCLFGWTASNFAPPITTQNFPLPAWSWTMSMWTVAVICFITCVYALMKMLDHLAYPINDARRLMR